MTPRWSVLGGGQNWTASMAGLPALSASVWVGPPLLASGPSSGLTAVWSPMPVSPQVESLERLYPLEVSAAGRPQLE